MEGLDLKFNEAPDGLATMATPGNIEAAVEFFNRWRTYENFEVHIIDGNNYANAVVLLSTEELEEAYNEIKEKGGEVIMRAVEREGVV